MDEKVGANLLALAETSIRHGLEHGQPVPVDYDTIDPDLLDFGASFVTLHREGRLRGCIGSYRPTRTLAEDVAANAYAAAFADSRFLPLEADELDGLELSISIMGPLEPVVFSSEYELVSQLEIGEDGLVIEDQGRRALFLPQVWGQAPDPVVFLAQLKVKAGLPMTSSPTMKAWKFRVDVVGRDAR